MNKVSGFITLYRQILDWEWYGDINTFRLFVHLLLTVNYKDGKFQGKTIQRGQIVTSLSQLATSAGLSIQQTKTALSHLISTNEITNESCSQYRIITVVNYDKYQTATNEVTNKQQATNKASNKQLTNEATNDQQQSNNSNNINKGTNKQRNNNNPSSRGSATDEAFAVFWDLYPKKVSKPAAQRAWKKIRAGEIDEVIEGLEKWKLCDQWNRDGGQFIPYPATWLNDRRWENVPAPIQTKASAPARTVVAQQYEQRDYTDETWEAMQRLIAMAGGGACDG